MIQELALTYPIKVICHVLEVPRSSYYAWLSTREQREQKEIKKEVLLLHIKRVFHEKKQTYGYLRIFKHLREEEKIHCYQNQIKKLMKEENIRVKRKRKYIRTTDSNHASPISPNLLNQNFTASSPNQTWIGDITYLWTVEGWMYLAGVMDLFSRKVIGWSLEPHMRSELIMDALQKAIQNRKHMPSFQTRRNPALYQAESLVGPEASTDPLDSYLIFHSDRGSQYASKEYRSVLQNQNILSSMSRQGNCYDNAVMESFFHTLKQECIDQLVKPTRAEMRSAIFEYIETFYNRNRLHSTLKYQSPVQFEQRYMEMQLKVQLCDLVYVV